ncbi:hypothetical protein [Thermospira aquatica]|uniref:Uncharacterized protein n=1 Tax=Thermospira aquatica TaxID=2828656 RepID=A0AAX3BA62_9SPIR|nr:hypothetical protein [Thermospira aquatica]URA09140.1 hypothetical protein KDW03_06420 [Thermospira aquatica]
MGWTRYWKWVIQGIDDGEGSEMIKRDLTAATRGNVTVRFNNTNGEPTEEQKALRDEIYEAFVADSRVSQALDPWQLESKEPGREYNYANEWSTVKNTYLDPLNIPLENFDRNPNPELVGGKRNQNMLLHRHHLHITVF